MDMICKICNKKSEYIFSSLVLKKYDVKYFCCPSCEFIQTEEPYWMEEAYKYSINIEDTGLVSRNILFAKRTSAILFTKFNKKGLFVDYAGGYGLFVRLMRDFGFDFFWSDAYTKNILSRGFEYNPKTHQNIEAITLFECLEHFNDPVSEIKKLVEISPNIIFSTETYNRATPAPDEWDYYGFSHGQHISFYSGKTLETIAKKLNLNLCSNGKSYHLLTTKKIGKTVFNILLKISLTGFPLLIKRRLRSKTLSDFKKIKLNRSILE